MDSLLLLLPPSLSATATCLLMPFPSALALAEPRGGGALEEITFAGLYGPSAWLCVALALLQTPHLLPFPPTSVPLSLLLLFFLFFSPLLVVSDSTFASITYRQSPIDIDPEICQIARHDPSRSSAATQRISARPFRPNSCGVVVLVVAALYCGNLATLSRLPAIALPSVSPLGIGRAP